MDVVDVREPSDMNGLKGLIMPGGESTTLRKLLVNSGLWDAISGSDIPIMATCAGAILMGESDDTTFEKMDFRIDREGLASLIEPWLVKPELKSALALTLPMDSISSNGRSSLRTPLFTLPPVVMNMEVTEVVILTHNQIQADILKIVKYGL